MTITLPNPCLVAACALALIANVSAQQPPKFYEELIKTPIVPQRSAADIQADLTASGNDAQKANTAIHEAQLGVNQANRWIAANKSDMDALKARINAAKKEKRDADRVSLEAQQKQLDLVDDYLKKSKDIRDAELNLASAQKDLVTARTAAYQAELDLSRKSGAIKSASATDPNLTKIVMDAAQAGENTLMLMKAAADKNQDVASQMTKLADRRIDLVQSRNKLLSEDRIRTAAASAQK